MDKAKLAGYVQEYRRTCLPNLERVLDHTRQEKGLGKAIDRATTTPMPNGGKHPHQYRISKETLHEVKERLLAREGDLEDCACFGEVHEIVNASKTTGFGVLAVYDTALRIAMRVAPGKGPA